MIARWIMHLNSKSGPETNDRKTNSLLNTTILPFRNVFFLLGLSAGLRRKNVFVHNDLFIGV